MEVEDILDLNKIHCMNNIEGMKLLIPDDTIDLTVTSPPYDGLRTYNGYSFDFESVAKELYRVTKDGGVVVWVVGDATIKGDETGTSFRQALFFKEIGFNLHDTMFYIKNGGLNSGSLLAYQQKVEYMFVFSKGRPKSINLIKDRPNKHLQTRKKKKRKPDGTTVEQIITPQPFGVRYNYWIYNTGKDHSTKDIVAFKHPAIFPEQLAQDHILSWSNEGDIVFDPFMGSGTTAKMAALNSRSYIGFEISQEYVDIATERLIKAKDEINEFNQ